MAIVLLALATAATPKPVNAFWFTCATPHHTQCVSHVMPKHRGQRTHGFWEVRKAAKYIVFPMFRSVRHVKAAYRQATRAVTNTLSLFTTYYCLTGETASGRMAGPGIVASYILPWGAHVRDVTTGWEGYVLDHPDSHTQADEWLPCGQNFPTGTHVWQVMG